MVFGIKYVNMDICNFKTLTNYGSKRHPFL
jgi:hypothetical protein